MINQYLNNQLLFKKLYYTLFYFVGSLILQINYKILINNQLMGNTTHYVEAKNKKLESRNKALQHQFTQIKQKLSESPVSEQLKAKVLDATVVELVNMLNKSIITSYLIVLIFAQQTLKVQNICNVLTEDNFDQALQMAQKCDAVRSKNPEKKNWVFGDQQLVHEQYAQEYKAKQKFDQKFFPALFGIPISVKEQIKMDGFACTAGCLSRIDNIQPDGPIMICLKNSGMIPFARTNVPQLGMTFETNNNLYGRSLNPWNLDRTVGGSSGGQAGLIAGRGSPIGIGSDVGGSIRIPTQFCGLYGLKHSTGRLSIQGHSQVVPSLDSGNNMRTVVGPLGKSVEDLALWMKVALELKHYRGQHDPFIKLIPFDQNKYLKIQKISKQSNKRIGYIRKMDILEPTKASMRAVDETVEILEKLGFEMVQLKLPNELETVKIYMSEIMAEGGMKSYKEVLKGEEPIEQYKMQFLSQSVNHRILSFALFLLKKFMPRMGSILQGAEAKQTVYDYYLHSNQFTRLKKQFVQYLRGNKVDLLISPGFGCQACTHKAVIDITPAACYTFIWNVLDMAVGSQPITVVKQEQEQYQSKHDDLLSSALKKTAIGSIGLPVGIQVVGLPFMQEQVLGLMKVIEREVKFSQKHPLPNLEQRI